MPKWLDNAIFYEIYPQSFKDTDSDGIGNINGIIQKLDYIKELGCNALWLNPCFLSPFDDAGYDVQDYFTVAPRYGTNDDLCNLFAQAHRLGLHVILDLVPGHTSYKHEWFKQSMLPDENDYSDRYIWTKSIWECPGDMQCLRGISQRDGSVALNFFSTQPALNYGFYKPDPSSNWQQATDSPAAKATKEAMKDVMRFWLSQGCDGFRVDMAGSLVKNDSDGLGTIELWREFRAFLDDEFPEAAMVSEWGEPDKSLLGGFHMDFLLHFGPSHYNDLFRCDEPYFSSRGKGNLKDFTDKYIENYSKAGGKGLICIPSGNHDMDRLAKYLTHDEMKIAFSFILSMPGAPFIYYGDEIGMRYVEGLNSVEGGFGRTGSRSPMQWDNSANAGFSCAPSEKLYIPLDPSGDRPTVKAQINDVTSLRSEVKRLISIRLLNPALQSNAKISFVKAEGYPMVYIRECCEQKILVAINPSSEAVHLKTECFPKNVVYHNGGKAVIENGVLTLDGCTSVFFEV